MASYTPRSYETARTIFGILEFVAWTAVVVGIIAAFAASSATGSSFGRSAGMAVFLAAVPGIALSVVGLIAAALVQNCRAGVDSAEMSGHMLKIAEEQLKISKEAHKASLAQSASFAQVQKSPAKPATPVAEPASSDASAASPAPKVAAAEAIIGNKKEPPVFGRAPTLETITHDGVSIRRTEDAFFIGELRFTELEPAKAFIDENLSKAKKPLPS